jgi:RNA polymerase sigma factor for flagellar operon FliA
VIAHPDSTPLDLPTSGGHVPPSVDYEQLLVSNLPLISSIAKRAAVAQRMPFDDFTADVILRLMDRHYGVLRQFRWQCSLATFLKTVVKRMSLDVRIAQWGKWRPSTRSRLAGPTVVALERLTIRDGLPFEQACAILRTSHRVVDTRLLEAHHRAFVPRQRVRFVEMNAIVDEPASTESADRTMVEAEAGRTLDEAIAALDAALGALSAADRALIALRFRDGLSVAEIARALDLDQKRLHRRYAVLLKRLRKALEQRRLSRQLVLCAIGYACSRKLAAFGPRASGLLYAKAS